VACPTGGDADPKQELEEIRAAIAAWVEAQRKAMRDCAALAEEMNQNQDGTGITVTPICLPSQPPAELVPWLEALGYDVNALIFHGVG
jgi:hypothetical protein